MVPAVELFVSAGLTALEGDDELFILLWLLGHAKVTERLTLVDRVSLQRSPSVPQRFTG